MFNLASLATKFPAAAANPVGALLFSPSFWKTIFAIALCAGIYFGLKYMYDSHMELHQTVAEQQQVIDNQKRDIDELKISNETLTFAIEAQQKTIAAIEWRQRQNSKALDTLRRKFSENDIGKLAKEKPALVEGIINNAVKDRTRCFALITGAEKVENEVNSQCAQLLE